MGSAACAACHTEESAAWRGSHHDLAMAEASEDAVLGDFDDATFTHDGVTSRFFKRDGRFFVNTEGPDGRLADFEISYTFGVTPLQQYLIAFPKGRYQALGIAWDARSKEEGGQRWFHLYPREHIPPGDALHWTGINQNWNFMCADCHSTNLRRNYDFPSDRYETTWSEIDVSCEACHGPGSKHLAWAEKAQSKVGSPQDPAKGLVVAFHERRSAFWEHAPDAVTAHLSPPASGSRTEIEVCAPCHSRRAAIADGFDVGKPLLDSYRLSLLTDPLYHPDGQIQDEVFEYGSFLQSRMYAAGVTCSDCHDPHSLALKAEGNEVCAQCHLPDRFDTPAHHFHASGGPGSQCVNCHAPATTYMVVDPRRDHSFRIPRPDLSATPGTPNACTGCHKDRTPQWAADTVAAWYGEDRRREPHFGQAVAAGRANAPGARDELMALADHSAEPAIVRATALTMLGRRLDGRSFAAILKALHSPEAILRLAALDALDVLDPRRRYQVIFPLLEDPVRVVRLEAARLLAPVPPDALPENQRQMLLQAFAEYEDSLNQISDRPESLMTLGNFYRDRGNREEAEKQYKAAIERHPTFAPAYVNLGDFYRAEGRGADAGRVIAAGLTQAPDDAGLLHAYGLLLIREKRYTDAVPILGRAAALDPDTPRYGYIYALALERIGNNGGALQVLEGVHRRHGNDPEILHALATAHLQRGERTEALKYAEALARLSPEDPMVLHLLQTIRQSPDQVGP